MERARPLKPLLIIGSNGQLARALHHLRPDAVLLDRLGLDLAYPDQVEKALQGYDAAAVINAAAYTQVDKAEQEEMLAMRINADSPASMMRHCKERHIPFIHISSDYVFDGRGDTAWTEEDIPAPLNAYGRTKRAGEEAIRHIGGKYLILRTSWVFDAQGKNFFNTVLRLAAERNEVKIVNDQYGAPTYAPHLAQMLFAALEKAMHLPLFPSGIYHLCNSGVTSWHGFASAIVKQARESSLPLAVESIYPIHATDYPLPASRPYNSRLDCNKIKNVLGVHMPAWEEGVKECFKDWMAKTASA